MHDDPATDDDGTARPDCPECSRPIATVTVIGPTDGFAAPCGCRMPPTALETPRLE